MTCCIHPAANRLGGLATGAAGRASCQNYKHLSRRFARHLARPYCPHMPSAFPSRRAKPIQEPGGDSAQAYCPPVAVVPAELPGRRLTPAPAVWMTALVTMSYRFPVAEPLNVLVLNIISEHSDAAAKAQEKARVPFTVIVLLRQSKTPWPQHITCARPPADGVVADHPDDPAPGDRDLRLSRRQGPEHHAVAVDDPIEFARHQRIA